MTLEDLRLCGSDTFVAWALYSGHSIGRLFADLDKHFHDATLADLNAAYSCGVRAHCCALEHATLEPGEVVRICKLPPVLCGSNGFAYDGLARYLRPQGKPSGLAGVTVYANRLLTLEETNAAVEPLLRKQASYPDIPCVTGIPADATGIHSVKWYSLSMARV